MRETYNAKRSWAERHPYVAMLSVVAFVFACAGMHVLGFL